MKDTSVKEVDCYVDFEGSILLEVDEKNIVIIEPDGEIRLHQDHVITVPSGQVYIKEDK
jgi:hypothetical protein